MVMREGSRSEGRGFKSRHFFTLICCKNCNDIWLKRPKINEKEARVGPLIMTIHLVEVQIGSSIQLELS